MRFVYKAGLGAVAASLCAVATAWAQTPDRDASPCFEIIAPQPNAQPRSPVLLNKCTGDTWLLVPRQGRRARGYHWVRLALGEPAATATPAKPRTAAPPVAATAGAQKCFVFNGRRFCE
jgi:hypothetical protein